MDVDTLYLGVKGGLLFGENKTTYRAALLSFVHSIICLVFVIIGGEDMGPVSLHVIQGNEERALDHFFTNLPCYHGSYCHDSMKCYWKSDMSLKSVLRLVSGIKSGDFCMFVF